MLTLQSASGREGPATTTMSLILNLGNGTLCTPIHRLGQCNRRRRDEGDAREAGICGTARMTRINLCILQETIVVNLPQLLVQRIVEAVHLLSEFVVQHVRVLIDSQLEADLTGGIALVVFGNLVLVLIEDLHAETLLSLILIVLVVFQLQLKESERI